MQFTRSFGAIVALPMILLACSAGCGQKSASTAPTSSAALATYEGTWTGSGQGERYITEVVISGKASPCSGNVRLQGTSHLMTYDVVWHARDGEVVGLYGKKGAEDHVLARVRLTDGLLSGQVTLSPEVVNFLKIPAEYSFSRFSKKS